MNLTDQERGMGFLVVTCLCCGNIYKAHQQSNSLTFSMTPNYGCNKCQGIRPLKESEPLPAHPGCCDICDTGGCCKEESEEENGN